jgi:glutathione S-transferase
MSLPILYSLQHCPFAMRARMALLMAKQDVILRAVITKNKPAEMLEISPKGTVPILLLPDCTVIDESLNIMNWALQQSDPSDLLYKNQPELYCEMLNIISNCDTDFRINLSAYKHSKRYHLEDESERRSECEIFITQLESRLQSSDFFFGDKLSMADLAILPNIRQFVNVDRKWFRLANYPCLTKWLASIMQSLLFNKTMRKYPLWIETREEFLFNWD